jgi:hypothetical protein
MLTKAAYFQRMNKRTFHGYTLGGTMAVTLVLLVYVYSNYKGGQHAV